MIGIFQKMLSDEYKTAFVQKLENKLGMPGEVRDSIINYIKSSEFDNDIKRLCAGDYFFLPPRQSMVRKNHSNRRRTVYIFDEKESYLLKFMTFVLMDFDYLYSPSLCSFRTENLTNVFFKKLRRIDPKRKLYIVKADIHDFGNSIDQDILISDIEPFLKEDPLFFNFARWLMTRNEFYRHGKLIKERVSIIDGLPIGNFFKNMYLRQMDLELEPESVLYMRYTDDIAFFTDSYEKTQWALKKIREYAYRQKLEINEEKTQIFKPGEGAELLGIQIFDGGFDIGDFAIKKLTDKLKRYCDKKIRRVSYGKCTREQIMGDMIRFYDRVFFGKKYNDHELNWVVHAFPIITRIDGLKKIDACAQNCIRITGTCRKTKARYRVRYKHMVKAGYRNLVHAYYHGYDVENKIIQEQIELMHKEREARRLSQIEQNSPHDAATVSR